MQRRTVLTLSTAACLSGMCALYGLFFSPWLSPQAEVFKRQRIRVGDGPQHDPESARQAETYLPDQKWAATAGYQYRAPTSGRSFVYAEKWEIIGDSDRMRFEPFAMIWRPGKEGPNEQPITIVSDKAVVRFAQKLSLTNPQPGRVIGGALEGPVRIRGPKGLAVDGQNINFEEQARRVWSDLPLKFAYGANSGTATGLELDLIPLEGPPDDDRPAIAGIRIVRLLKDVAMNLASEPKDPTKPVEHVHVTSAGSFEFGVESHIAVFQKDVHVVRPTAPAQADTLDTQTLTIVFEPAAEAPLAGGAEIAAAPPPAAKPEEGLTSLGGDLEFRRLRAEGPGTTARSPRGKLVATMQELTYDEQTHVVVLRDAQQVHLVQEQSELFCPEVTATLDADGQLDRTVCRGAGRIFRYIRGAPATGNPPQRPIEFAGEWARQLSLEPDPEEGSTLDLITLKGRARLSQPRRMALGAETVCIWVTPMRKPEETRSAATPARPEGETRPRRMLALGEAEFASPQMTGQTERLEVWFEDGRLPEPPPEHRADAGVRRKVLRLPAPTTARQKAATAAEAPRRKAPKAARAVTAGRASQSAPAFAAVEEAKKSPPASRKDKRAADQQQEKALEKPPHITANLIRVLAMMDGDDTQVAHVISQGKVHVTQQRKPGEKPFDLWGERLDLRNYSEKHQVLHLQGLLGNPARISDRQLQLEGNDIHFNRGANHAQVNGPGVLRLPASRGLDGKPLEAPQPLDVHWKERMEFDGETADFYAHVETKMNGSDLKCQEMHVTLGRRIDFSADSDGSQETEVRSIVCRDGVKLNSLEYIGNRVVEKRQADVFEFTFEQATGDISAQGPGWMKIWQRGGGNRAALGAGQAVRANRPPQVESSEWEYTRINFSGQMSGNSNNRSTSFADRVRIVYGPVPSSADEIDTDNLPRNGGWMKCDRLKLTQNDKTPAKEAYVEVVAGVDVALSGMTEQGQFHAKAETVAFDQSKGLYILIGDGRRDATIWREQRVGAAAGRADTSAQRIEFNPSQNTVRIDRGSNAQGSP